MSDLIPPNPVEGLGFSERNLEQMRLFYLAWPPEQISQTAYWESTSNSLSETLSRNSSELNALAQAFPLPWSAYVRLLSVQNLQGRAFYQTEALRCGWGSDFAYERLSTVRAGDFTYPKLMAWEGALGVVPPECDGMVVSPKFPVFTVNTDAVLPEVLDIYFRTPGRHRKPPPPCRRRSARRWGRACGCRSPRQPRHRLRRG